MKPLLEGIADVPAPATAPLSQRERGGSEGEQAMATPSPARSSQRSARDRCCPSNRSSERSRRILLAEAALTWLPDT